MGSDDKRQTDGPSDAAVAHPRPRVVESTDLLQSEREVLIRHRGEVYRLRETRNGKLILGK